MGWGHLVSGYVLVVDDDPAILEALATLLALENQICRTAATGEAAIEAAAAEPPALILLDWNLPGLNGVDVFRKLRADGINSPTVLMSATIGDLSERAQAHGFDASLTKPFTLAQVTALLDRFASARTA